MKALPLRSAVCQYGLFFIAILVVLVFTACGTEKAVIVDPVIELGPEPVPSPVVVQPEEPFQPLIEMISISGGSFQMGSPVRREFQPRENPVHEVTVRDFALGKYAVTLGQYFEVTGELPNRFHDNPEDDGPDGWMNLPVEEINWYDALLFCNKLSIIEGLDPVYRINGSADPDDWVRLLLDTRVINSLPLPTRRFPAWDEAELIIGANGYRLPTEAEWEFAARGGRNSRGYTYAGTDDRVPDKVAWYYDNSGKKAHEVGKKEPNELGLYDMSGNVFEWCWDWFGAQYYGSNNDNAQDPIGPSIGETRRLPSADQHRVLRGGSHGVERDFARVTYRQYNNPQSRFLGYGFRVARWE